MKYNYAIVASMLMLAFVLIAAQTHSLFLLGNANEARKTGGLRASVIETLNNLNGHHPQHDDPPVPFDRGAPDVTIH